MSNLLGIVQDGADQDARSRAKSVLPTLKALATPPLLINGLIVSLLLLEKHLLMAMGIVGGLVVGFIIYWALYFFAENVFGVFAPTMRSAPAPAPTTLLLFGFLAGGKFILIGALMYLMIAALHFNLVAFVVGFLVTQLCVSLSVINSLTKTKAAGR